MRLHKNNFNKKLRRSTQSIQRHWFNERQISIKLKDGAIPYIKLIRRVHHAMQEPLKLELDKLVEENILHKVDISDPIEWLNSCVCVKKANGKIRLS